MQLPGQNPGGQSWSCGASMLAAGGAGGVVAWWFEEFGDVLCGLWSCEFEALCCVAVEVAEVVELGVGFDAFGDDGEAEGYAESDDGFGDWGVAVWCRDGLDEGAVNLECGEWEAFERGER